VSLRRTCVEVRQERAFRDHGGAVREASSQLGNLDVFAVLQREFDGALQGEGTAEVVGIGCASEREQASLEGEAKLNGGPCREN